MQDGRYTPEGITIDPSMEALPYDPGGWQGTPQMPPSDYDAVYSPYPQEAIEMRPAVPREVSSGQPPFDTQYDSAAADAWIADALARGNGVRFATDGTLLEIDGDTGEVVGRAPDFRRWRMQ